MRPTFVLVHGAWHGGWCWAAVADRLRARGHACYAPTLRGLAHRAAQLRPDINADTHVDDVASLIETLDLRNVVLALHSYAGLLGPALLARLRPRLAHIAWIEAVVPTVGPALGPEPEPAQCMLDLVLPEAAERYRRMAREQGDGWRMPVPDPAQFNLPDAALRTLVAQRLTEHPLRSFSEAVQAPQEDVLRFANCSYLLASDRASQPYAAHVAKAQAAGWPVEQIPGGHLLMLTQAGAVTGFLLRHAGNTQNAPAVPSGELGKSGNTTERIA